jgi:hypothetical protein
MSTNSVLCALWLLAYSTPFYAFLIHHR